jgi:competence protein ComEC
MKGYWHFVALSVSVGVLAIILGNYWFLAGLFLWLFYLFYNERLRKLPLLITLTFFLFFSTYIPMVDKTSHSTNTNYTQQQNFQGKIVRPVLINPKKVDFILQDDLSNQKLLVIYFPDENDQHSHKNKYAHLAYGASCTISGQIEQPNVSRNPGQLDFNYYLESQGITNQMIVDSLEEIQCQGSSFLNHIYSLRTDLMYFVSESVSVETFAWISALVLGDDSQLDEKVVELFQRWGLSHLLAISGLHIGLIVGLVYFLIVKLNIVTKEKAQWTMIFFLPIYALIAGGQPSVWRASTMVLIFIVLNKLKLRLSATDTLSIVFLLLILFNKYIVYHVGFQLSFAVTFGLILSRKLIFHTQSSFYQGLQISFISQMMILPLQFTYFSFFQPLSILVNVIVVPYFSLFVIPLMFLMLLFSGLPKSILTIFDITFVNIQSIFVYLLEGVDKTVNYPIVIGDFPIIATVIYYCLFYLFMHNFQNEKLIEAFKYGVFLTILMTFLILRPYTSSVGTVTMLDIGQGDAFVIELPYRKGVLLVDAGASFSFTDFEPTNKVYNHVIKPYLYSRGIMKIDAIFISHEDLDHMGSIDFIVKDMKVDQIIMSHYYELESDQESLWEKEGIQITRVNANESITVNGQLFQVLGPTINQHSANENSLILYTNLGGKRWLFTGDIDKATEKELTNNYNQLRVDVLKVAHHGSNTSTDQQFIETIKPGYALISAGVNNSYGHPASEVLETLEDMQIQILRTDKDGAVQFKFKKNQGTFFKYLP